ncbi:MAG: efflux RND transporter periplasmic adaptor subunit [Bacteroidales bacterium]|nr:efflux RND transporter periplasmic adaptor subunit [Bacteroidales bacterium]
MKPRIRTFISIAAVSALLAVSWLFSRKPVTVYSLAEAKYADIVSTLTVSGTISPSVEIAVKPRITAYISEIVVKCGDTVRKGQRLMILDAIPDAALLEEADAAVALEKISVKQAESDLKRAEKLHAGHSISGKEYEAAQSALDIAKERLTLASNRRNIILRGGSERSPEQDASVVFSPVSGIISEILVNEGETVSPYGVLTPGTTLCKIADDGPLVFKGLVDETDIALLRKGMNARLILSAAPGNIIPARIESISSFGKAGNGFTRFEIKASIDSVPEGVELRSGYSANAKIETSRVEHALSIPEECIHFDDELNPYVLRLISNPKKSQRQLWETVPVKLGVSDGNTVQIVSNLSEKDFVQHKVKIKI